MVESALDVLVDVLLELFRPDDPTRKRRLRKQNIAQKIAHLPAQPAADRYSESHLSPIDDLSRDEPGRDLLEQVFRPYPAHLQVFGQAGRKFDHIMIEKRRAGLE